MPKSFILHATGFTTKQQEKFDEMMDQFFEEVMADGRSQASYNIVPLSPKSHLYVTRKPMIESGEIVEKMYAKMCELDTPKRGELRRILTQLLP